MSRFEGIMVSGQGENLYHKSNELPYDKTNKMTSAPRENSDQPRHLPSLISLHCAL